MSINLEKLYLYTKYITSQRPLKRNLKRKERKLCIHYKYFLRHLNWRFYLIRMKKEIFSKGVYCNFNISFVFKINVFIVKVFLIYIILSWRSEWKENEWKRMVVNKLDFYFYYSYRKKRYEFYFFFF